CSAIMADQLRANEGHGRWGRVAVFALAACSLAGPLSGGALNEHCVVSVLNRTAYVQADGSWVLPNVPANIGRVRARATCVEDGVTRAGQSDYFVVPRNGIVKVPDIVFDVVQPIPSKLTLATADPTLRAVGATAQLAAVATYPNGGTADVTAGASGTNYTSSN